MNCFSAHGCHIVPNMYEAIVNKIYYIPQYHPNQRFHIPVIAEQVIKLRSPNERRVFTYTICIIVRRKFGHMTHEVEMWYKTNFDV